MKYTTFAADMRRSLLSLLLVITVAVTANAYSPTTLPNPKQGGQGCYVCNPDSIITAEDVQYLNQCAQRLEQNTDVELCVVAVKDIDGQDAFDFCYELFQRWGIGKKGKNTGVLLLLAVNSRDIRIMTGGSIEGILTDAICDKIIRQDITPALQQGDYSAGLCQGALRIYEVCNDGDAPEELRNAASVTNRYNYAEEEEDDWRSIVAVSVGFLLIYFLCLHLLMNRKCPRCGKRKLRKVKSTVVNPATYRHSGTGLALYQCKCCGYQKEKTFVIPQKTRVYVSGGSGGHGGGFSGGSFGGGSTFGGGAGGKF